MGGWRDGGRCRGEDMRLPKPNNSYLRNKVWREK